MLFHCIYKSGSPEKSEFGRLFAICAFIYFMIYTIFGMNLEGTNIHLFIEKKNDLISKKFFVSYFYMFKKFFFIIYDLEMTKVSR